MGAAHRGRTPVGLVVLIRDVRDHSVHFDPDVVRVGRERPADRREQLCTPLIGNIPNLEAVARERRRSLAGKRNLLAAVNSGRDIGGRGGYFPPLMRHSL
eukprot:1564035-Prymnesium_polylepis.1